MYKALSKLVLVGMLAFSLPACGPSEAVPLDEPVNVNGSVTAGGKPVSNVTLKLQPLENGYEKVIPLGADGSFTVETHPGKYAYYFIPKEGAKSMPSNLSSYAQASMERTIQVQAGKAINITLN